MPVTELEGVPVAVPVEVAVVVGDWRIIPPSTSSGAARSSSAAILYAAI